MMFLSGVILAAGTATTAYGNTFFRFKRGGRVVVRLSDVRVNTLTRALWGIVRLSENQFVELAAKL